MHELTTSEDESPSLKPSNIDSYHILSHESSIFSWPSPDLTIFRGWTRLIEPQVVGIPVQCATHIGSSGRLLLALEALQLALNKGPRCKVWHRVGKWQHHLPSGNDSYIAMENGHRNSEFSHEK